MAEPRILMSLRLPPLLYDRLHRAAGPRQANAMIVEAVARLLDELERLEEVGGGGAGQPG